MNLTSCDKKIKKLERYVKRYEASGVEPEVIASKRTLEGLKRLRAWMLDREVMPALTLYIKMNGTPTQ